jgi:glycosyltransferase involved in cell wall biosynthesis
MIVFISPFSQAGASTSRLIHLAEAFGPGKMLLLPKTDKYGGSEDRDWFVFPLERKSFALLPLWWIRACATLFRLRPAAVVFLKPHLFTLPPALFWGIITGRPLVFDCDEWDPATLVDNDEPAWKVKLTEWLARKGFDAATLIVYGNHLTLEEKIPEEYRKKTLYVPNGADTGVFKPGSEAHDGFNVMYAGMLFKIKHIMPLVDAIDRARGKVPGLRCTVVGGGDRLEELKSIVAKRGLAPYFTFTGMVGHDRLPEILKAADVLIAPFEDLNGIRYQSNVKVFEYMACGKPVVASRVGELDRVLSGGAGLIVRPGDPEALANAIAAINADKAAAEAMGAKARAKVMDEYDWRVLGKRFKERIDNITR